MYAVTSINYNECITAIVIEYVWKLILAIMYTVPIILNNIVHIKILQAVRILKRWGIQDTEVL